jgi:ankyrin repeat protein
MIADTSRLFGMLPYDYINNNISYQLAQQQLMILLNKEECSDRDYKKIDTLCDKISGADGITKPEFINICLIASLFDPRNFYTYHAIERLLKFGANVNQMYTYCVDNRIKKTNPLLLATENRPAPVIGLLLLYGADIMALDSDGNTALIMAAQKKKFEVVELLIQALENNIHQQAKKCGLLSCSDALKQTADEWQVCPLDVINHCIAPFLPSNARQYVPYLAAYINHQNYLGNNALMYAAGNNHFPMVGYLLKNGADAGFKNKSEYSAYNLTTRDDIKKMLREAL